MNLIKTILSGVAAVTLAASTMAAAKPNVILIVTDDQGYGDIAAHGHPHLKTPHMDRLWRESVRLENFHVDPTCAPTRAALMTGRYSGRVGVWHTTSGRNLLRKTETTMAEVFRAAGYRTGVFGKWHLGDTFPYAPRHRGFDDSVVHGGGGVGQTPDYWGNDYFEDHFNDNGTWRPFQGYCTDVWFREGLRFIRESGDRPFFLYLPTNAAHQTLSHVAERYRAIYDDTGATESMKIFWGMLSNLDDNLGVLMDRLEGWGLLDNTLIVLMGDNGTTMGPPAVVKSERGDWSATYNAGMRGHKASHYDGGHRVFCFIRPASGIFPAGRAVTKLTAHIDLLPTLAELCGIALPGSIQPDGRSLVPLLHDPDHSAWPERTLVVESQRINLPEKWRQTAVMTDRWRLVDDRELYDMHADPGQQRNVIDAHPQVAERMRRHYESWWQDVSRSHTISNPLHIGAEEQNPVQLNGHDWMPPSEGLTPWIQSRVVERVISNGTWNVRAVRSGRYAITLRERPEIAAHPLQAATAALRVGDGEKHIRRVAQGSTGVTFEVEIEAGDVSIQSWLDDADGTSRGAYFVDVEFLDGE